MLSVPHPTVRVILPTLINFDDVADGTVIDTHYSNKGVTFSAVSDMPASTWSAVARSWTAESSPNVISIVGPTGVPFFDASLGGIQANFSSPQRWVSISAKPVTLAEDIGQTFSHKPYIEGFDAQGDFIGGLITYYGPSHGDQNWGTWQKLILSSTSANISAVRFSSQYANSPPHVFALFDDFRFSDRIPPVPLGPQIGR